MVREHGLKKTTAEADWSVHEVTNRDSTRRSENITEGVGIMLSSNNYAVTTENNAMRRCNNSSGMVGSAAPRR